MVTAIQAGRWPSYCCKRRKSTWCWPAAACLLQYLDRSIHHSGLWLQANVVEPGRFISDMGRMGIEVQRTDSESEGEATEAERVRVK